MMKKALFAALLSLFTVSFWGIEVGGHISSDTVWSPAEGPYIITSFLYIDAGVTLTILPGVQVQAVGAHLSDIYNFKWTGSAQPHAKMIIVHGTINAIGTPDNPITFDTEQAGEDYRWGGIYIYPGAPMSTFEYCEISNVFFCDYIPDQWSLAAISFENGLLKVSNCRFENNYIAVSTGNLKMDLVIYKCKFISNVSYPAPFGGSYFFGAGTVPDPIPQNNYKLIIARCHFTGRSSFGGSGYYVDTLFLFNTLDHHISEQYQNTSFRHEHGTSSSYGNVAYNGKGGWGCWTPTPSDTAFARRNRLYKQPDAAPIGYPLYVGAGGLGKGYVSDNYLHGNVRAQSSRSNATTAFIYNNIIESCQSGGALLFDVMGSTDQGGQVRFFNNLVRYIGNYQISTCVISRRTAPFIYNNHLLNFHFLQSSHNANEVYTNNIIDCNSWAAGGMSEEYYPLIINNCLSEALAIPEFWGSVLNGGGNFVADPMFIDPVNDNYQLSYESPCIDSGVNRPDLPDFDIRYHKRVVSATGDGPQTVDIGAYEYGSVYIGGIRGYVYDAVTNLPVDCVKIEISGTLPEFSDTLGCFQYPTGVGNYTVRASRWDYKDLVIPDIEVVLGEETLLSIPLEPENVDNDESVQMPLAADFGLNNYPNPFNPSTTIGFIAPEAGNVRLSVLNIKGQKVKELYGGPISKGHHSVLWDGLDDRGVAVSSGVYFVRLEMAGRAQVHKMVLMK
jgi:hypothetical protein